MRNYILADYKRVVTRIPRIFLIFVYNLAFLINVIVKCNKAAGSFTSVALLGVADNYYYTFGAMVIGMVAFISSFSFDFKSKTMQVAIGLGVSRLKVLIAKLIQVILVVITDLIFSSLFIAIACLVTGMPLAPHQVFTVFMNMVTILIYTCCVSSLSLFVVYRTQNMLVSMVTFIVLTFGAIRGLIRWLTQLAPDFVARMQLDRFTFETCTEVLRTNALMGRLDILCLLGILVVAALGVALGWVVFRKMELDF